MTEIGAILTYLNTATEAVKFIRESTSALSDAETKLKFAELIDNLADSKIGLADLKFELEAKNNLIRDLEEALRNRTSLEFRDNFYYKEGDDVPFCPHCVESNGDAIHLSVEEWDSKKGHYFRHCPKCDNDFKTRDSQRDSEISSIYI